MCGSEICLPTVWLWGGEMVSAEVLKTENQDGPVEGRIDGWGFEGGEEPGE